MLNFRVVRQGGGVFGTVASLLDSSGLTRGTEIGPLWSALPEVRPPFEDGRWLFALPAFVPPMQQTVTTHLPPPGHLRYVVLWGQPELRDPAAVAALLNRYPHCHGVKVVTRLDRIMLYPTDLGPAVGVMWPEPAGEVKQGEPRPPELIAAHVASQVPSYPRITERWLVLEVGDAADSLPPVLLWWVLLHGLSLLARYEPAAWAQRSTWTTRP